MTVATARSTCCLCDALCGIVVQHEEGKITEVRGDPDDVFSRGYICPKGVALPDVHNDPDRVRTPLRRTEHGFEEVSWDEALDDIADRIAAAQDAGGRDAAALYIGNPTAHSYAAVLFTLPLAGVLGTRNLYSSNSVDSAPRQLVSYLMYGAQTILELLLIGRRQLRGNNSWLHNSPRLVRGRDRCTLLMHPDDARVRAIGAGARVAVSSRTGAIETSVELSDEIMPGVVSLPHGFGHARPESESRSGDAVRLRVARAHAGVSVNDVTDDRAFDALSGTSALNGVPVTVRAV